MPRVNAAMEAKSAEGVASLALLPQREVPAPDAVA